MVEHGHEQPAYIDGGIVDVATASSVGGRVREQRDAWGRDARTMGLWASSMWPPGKRHGWAAAAHLDTEPRRRRISGRTYR